MLSRFCFPERRRFALGLDDIREPSFVLAQQLRQLGDIHRDPPRLFAREQLGLNVRFAPKSGH